MGVLTAALLFAGAASAATAELVTNGGFEAGDTGFSTELFPVSGSGFSYEIVSDAAGANSGTNYMSVDGGAFPTVDPVAWSQDVTIALGKDYIFSVALRSDTILGALSVRIGGVEIRRIDMATPGWESYAVPWTAGFGGLAALEIVQLSSASGAYAYALDDISLIYDSGVVPLPAGLPLLLAGLGALALAVGRRRKTTAR